MAVMYDSLVMKALMIAGTFFVMAVKIIGPLPIGRFETDIFHREKNEEYTLCLQDRFIFMRIHL